MCNGSPHLDGSRLRRTAPAGLALVLVLLVVSVASILAFAAASTSSRNLQFSATDLRSLKARYTSEAGIAAALVQLEADQNWSAGFTNATLPSDSSSSYTLTATSNLVGNTNVTAPDGTLVPFGTVYLLSTGTYNSLSRKTRALVSIGGNTVYRYAAYAKSSIDMSSNANTDSYNSSNGAYNTSTNISSNGSVGTEGLLTLYSNTVIHGNTSAARYQLNGTAQITGTQGAAPNVTLPAIDFSGPQTSNNNGTGWTITGGTMAYNSSTKALTGRGTITFNQGGTYYFSSVNISANSNLVVSSSVTSPVKIYVLNDYTTSSNFAMNNQTQKPSNLQFLVGGDMTIDSNSTFYGTMYAPNGDITFTSNTTLYGSVISGGLLQINSNQGLHYDVSLATDPALGGSSAPSVVMWERE